MSTLVASRDGGLREPRPRTFLRSIGPETRQYPDVGHRLGPFSEPTGEAFVVPWQLPEVFEDER